MLLKRTLKLVAAALAVTAACVLVATDLNGRSQVRRTTSALTRTERNLAATRHNLRNTRNETDATTAQVQALQASISENQSSLSSTNASISQTEAGIFFGGFDISALTNCLGGVTQALDQVAVGKTQGAISSLSSVSKSCQSAKPAGT